MIFLGFNKKGASSFFGKPWLSKDPLSIPGTSKSEKNSNSRDNRNPGCKEEDNTQKKSTKKRLITVSCSLSFVLFYISNRCYKKPAFPAIFRQVCFLSLFLGTVHFKILTLSVFIRLCSTFTPCYLEEPFFSAVSLLSISRSLRSLHFVVFP